VVELLFRSGGVVGGKKEKMVRGRTVVTCIFVLLPHCTIAVDGG
jgi:hypothetical protein